MPLSEVFETVLNYIYLFFKTYTVFWIFLTFLEFLFPAVKKQKIVSKHTLTELINGLVLASLIWPIDSSLRVYLAKEWFAIFLPYQILEEWITSLPLFIQVLIALFLLDTLQYLRHRLMHSKWLWGFHAMHHSALELRSTVHWRFHPIEYMITLVITSFFLHVMGFSGNAIQT